MITRTIVLICTNFSTLPASLDTETMTALVIYFVLCWISLSQWTFFIVDFQMLAFDFEPCLKVIKKTYESVAIASCSDRSLFCGNWELKYMNMVQFELHCCYWYSVSMVELSMMKGSVWEFHSEAYHFLCLFFQCKILSRFWTFKQLMLFFRDSILFMRKCSKVFQLKTASTSI